MPASVVYTFPDELRQAAEGPVIVGIGLTLNVTTISSVEAGQGALEIVHLKVYVFPAVPENVVFLNAGLANDPPTPATMLHPPVPTAGLFAARVTVVNPQVAAPV